MGQKIVLNQPGVWVPDDSFYTIVDTARSYLAFSDMSLQWEVPFLRMK